MYALYNVVMKFNYIYKLIYILYTPEDDNKKREKNDKGNKSGNENGNKNRLDKYV